MYNLEAYNKLQGFNMWMFVSFVLGLVAAILVYVLFLNKKADEKEQGVVKFFRDFLNFDFLTLEILLKVAYVTLTVMFVLGSFGFLYLGSIQGFLGSLFIAPVLLRLAFEGTILLLKLVKNTEEINKKLK
jgi:hypothetical protein